MHEVCIFISDHNCQGLGELESLRREQGWTVGTYINYEPIKSKLESRAIRGARVVLEGGMVGSCIGTGVKRAIEHGAAQVYLNLANLRTGREEDSLADRVSDLVAILGIYELLGDSRIVVDPPGLL